MIRIWFGAPGLGLQESYALESGFKGMYKVTYSVHGTVWMGMPCHQSALGSDH
jgi:hypothetical protein